MRRLRTCYIVTLLLAVVALAGETPLRSQTLTLSFAGAIQFNLLNTQLSPGGDLRINLSCIPGAGTATCPTTATIYLDMPTCGLQATSGPAAPIPSSAVEARVNTGVMLPLNAPTPPLNNGCGAELYTNAAFNPAGTVFPAYLYINQQSFTVPVGVTYQGVLTVAVDTL
jgi:hypothetical protein